ncbi:MAG: TonB-dependent receptor [Bacteroidales bacterium]|nr:TonB-dependent receptor [Bacteroidales bacterium]
MSRPLQYYSETVFYRKHFCKRLFSVFFVVGIFLYVNAQKVQIEVLDKVTNEPVEFAHIIVSYLNGEAQSSCITNTKGIGEYTFLKENIVHISSLGFQTLADTIPEEGIYTIYLTPEYYQLDNVVVTGQFRPQTIDNSIYKIEVLNSGKIKLKAASNMGDLLKNEQSFQYRSEGVLGDFLRIRGLSGEHVKILIDGMPVTGKMADFIELGQLSLYNVDHVEIIEGPVSVVYGSNALAGAINIITKDYSGSKLSGRISGYTESVGVYNFEGIFSKRIKRHTFSFNAARNFHSGWGPVDTSRHKIWKPKLQYISGGSYSYKYKNFNLKFNSDYLYEELRDLGPLILENLYEKALDGYHYTKRWNNSLYLINTFNDDFVVNFQAGYSYYNKRKITYLNDLVNLEQFIADNPDLHDTTYFHLLSARSFVSNKSGRKFEYQCGIDLSYEMAEGKRTQGDRSITDVAGFLNLIYKPVTELSIQPGIRYIYNSKYDSPLIYALNLKYAPGATTIRVSYGRGFRAPSLKQLYLRFIDSNHEIYGNENLKPETADNISLSTEYRLVRNKHAAILSVSLFYNSIQNAILLAVDTARPGWGMYFNPEQNDLTTFGIDAKITYNYFPRVTLSTGFVTTARSGIQKPIRHYYTTDFVGSARYHSPRYNYELAIFYKYTDDFTEFAGNFNSEGELIGVAERFVEGYHNMDITLSKSFLKEKITISTGIKNLFDLKMVDSYGNLFVHGSNSTSQPVGYGRTYFVKAVFAIDRY